MHRLRGPIGLVLVATLVVSQFTVVAASAVTAGGSDVSITAQSSDIEIVGVEMPAEMEPGKEYDMRVDIRNTGENAKQVEVVYRFDGDLTIKFEELVAAGDTIESRMPIDLRMITQSHRDRLYDGTYEHSITVGESTVAREVTISGLGTPTPTRTPIEDIETATDSTSTDGAATGGDGPGDNPVTLESFAFPDQIPVGGEGTMSITVNNPTDRMQTFRLAFRVDGARIAEDDLEVPPGQETMDLPVPYRMLSQNGDIEVGTHSWRAFVAGTERSGTFEIVEDSSGSSADAPSGESEPDANRATAADEGADETEIASPDQPQRGFFSNGESQFEFLDSFSLTVGGFILSAAGIFYQMLQGA